MAAATLKTEDYKKILDFTYLDPFDEDYHKKVLSLMKAYYSWNLVVYTKWASEGRITSYYSMGLDDEFISEMHNHYVTDRIRRRVAEEHMTNSWSGIFYSQEIDLSEYIGSKALDYLHEHNIYYFAILFLATDPMEHYVLCKTKREGPFSDHEKVVLQHIYRLISQNIPRRRRFQENRIVRSVLNRSFEQKGTGLILVDEAWNVLDFNETVFSIVPRNLNLTRVGEIAGYARTLFANVNGEDPESQKEKETVIDNGRRYTLEEVSFLDKDRKRQSYYMITIARNRQADILLNSEIAARYDLTERELQIAELLINGYSNKNMAEDLYISISTVKIHVSNIFRKLRVHTRMDAVMKLTKQ